MTETEPSVAALQAIVRDPQEQQLAAAYAPVLLFDAHEPFLPLAVGYTVFKHDADSPSFPRRIQLAPDGRPVAAFAIEYAIWWDWDISHLYELEHVWVFVDARGNVVRGEASWHGTYHSMEVDGKLPLEGTHLRLLSQPGKHALAPSADWFVRLKRHTEIEGQRTLGAGGVWVTPLFRNVIRSKSPQADLLVRTYLEKQPFVPSWKFSQRMPITSEMLVPWPALQSWIPKRVSWWLEELDHAIPPDRRRFLRIAHRGASAYAPENTLAAFQKALELGADMVEMDVRLSADGVPVVIHDGRLEHTTNGKGWVGDYTLGELKRLRVAGDQEIPALEEVIEFCREEELGMYIELKEPGTVAPVADLIRRYDVVHGTIVGSFQIDSVAAVKEVAPEILASVLFTQRNVDPVKLAQAIGAEYVHPCWERATPTPETYLTEQWVKRVRNAKLGLICWHEERPDVIAALRQRGVDGICSNQPDLLLM
ncbi:MAG TPA: hypothetical protein EYP04_11905 [Anaerolineae bacterium]|nr:hypothetical protein [Anaerolineae bacterium]HIQ04463.1 hypothetical protein [Anaerolineae bacterium]